MKKIIAGISLTVILICTFNIVNVKAAEFTVTQVGYYIWQRYGSYYASTVWYDLVSTENNNFKYWITINPDGAPYGSVAAAQTACINKMLQRWDEVMGSAQSSPFDNGKNPYEQSYIGSGSTVVYIYNLPQLDSDVTPVYPEPEPDPPVEDTWFEQACDMLLDVISEYLPEGSGIDEFILWLFGEDSEIHSFEITNIPTPSPIPTPTPTPTPIPYQVVINPTSGAVEYHYTNPSGTPIITSMPPQPNNVGGGIIENNNPVPYPIENYYYPEDPLTVPTSAPEIFSIQMPTGKVSIKEIDTTIDTVRNGIDELNEPISEIQNSFLIVPDSWFLLIGFIACIPILAGIISRLLK